MALACWSWHLSASLYSSMARSESLRISYSCRGKAIRHSMRCRRAMVTPHHKVCTGSSRWRPNAPDITWVLIGEKSRMLLCANLSLASVSGNHRSPFSPAAFVQGMTVDLQ